MKQLIAVMLLSLFAAKEAINRPVYKILLAQKGFAQFLQYDVEIPPLREFTFCAWLRFYDFTADQTIFAYVAKGNNRVMRLWLERGGTSVRLTVAGRAAASVQVHFVADTWTHLCLSYQADYGSWALYLDGHIVACEVSQALLGYVLPRGGSVLVGYGTGENDESNGIEGEVFGANMVLMSTIEKNIPAQVEPQYEMTLFPKNKLKRNKKNNYTIFLGNLTSMIDDLKPRPVERSVGQLKIPNDFLKHTTTLSDQDIGFDFVTKARFLDKETNFFSGETSKTTKQNKILFWDIVNKTGQKGNFKGENKISELSSSSTQELPEISLVETPPPVGQFNESYNELNLEFEKPPTEKSVYNKFSAIDGNTLHESKNPLEVETPPPLHANPNVYGQWTSSKFAGTVLDYIKSINFNSKPKPQIKAIPPTIPLTKISDSVPYATEYRISNTNRKISRSNKTLTPLKFQRTSFSEKTIMKRAKRDKQINVEILEDNLRENILKEHAQTNPINVVVTSRGDVEASTQRTPKTVDNQKAYPPPDETDTFLDSSKPQPFKVNADLSNHRNHRANTRSHLDLMTIMPVLKSVDYFTGPVESSENRSPEEKQDIFTRTLWKGNKWHNTKSYNNEYTPRQIHMETEEMKHSMVENVAEPNQKHQTIRVKYVAKDHKTIPTSDDDQYIQQGRKIAQRVSGKSDSTKGIAMLQYNHGYLPGHIDLNDSTRAPDYASVSKRKSLMPVKPTTNNFDKSIKIGNALNEGHVLGFNDEYTKISFFGGDEKVPDIHKYRSDIDNDSNDKVPPSLHAQVCKSMESLYQLVLYVKPDGSIDKTHKNITSPIKAANRAIEFILVNYQKCSVADTTFEEDPLLLIDWSKTPVRLFGGAYPQKTKELCGFI